MLVALGFLLFITGTHGVRVGDEEVLSVNATQGGPWDLVANAASAGAGQAVSSGYSAADKKNSEWFPLMNQMMGFSGGSDDEGTPVKQCEGSLSAEAARKCKHCTYYFGHSTTGQLACGVPIGGKVVGAADSKPRLKEALGLTGWESCCYDRLSSELFHKGPADVKIQWCTLEYSRAHRGVCNMLCKHYLCQAKWTEFYRVGDHYESADGHVKLLQKQTYGQDHPVWTIKADGSVEGPDEVYADTVGQFELLSQGGGGHKFELHFGKPKGDGFSYERAWTFGSQSIGIDMGVWNTNPNVPKLIGKVVGFGRR